MKRQKNTMMRCLRLNYKIELHAHIKEQSVDSKVSAKEYIKTLTEKGYYGIVSTDHFTSSQLDQSEGLGLKEKCDRWLNGYRALLKESENSNIKVFLGMEYTLEYTNDYIDILLYGLTEDMVKNCLIRPFITIQELIAVCKNNDIIMIQAHPERYGHHRLPEEMIDGYEIYNTKPRLGSLTYNKIIEDYVKDKTGLILTGGSDTHISIGIGTGGIETPVKVENMEELKRVLRDGDFKVIKEA